jgi:hypothetical protein
MIAPTAVLPASLPTAAPAAAPPAVPTIAPWVDLFMLLHDPSIMQMASKIETGFVFISFRWFIILYGFLSLSAKKLCQPGC